MEELGYKKERPWMKWLISSIAGLVVATFIMATNGVFSGELVKVEIMKFISDGFFVSGVLLLGVGLLIFCSRNGTFDMLSYAVKVAIRTIFTTENRESFYDYKQRMGEKVTPCAFLIVPGAVFLLLSVCFVGLFYQA